MKYSYYFSASFMTSSRHKSSGLKSSLKFSTGEYQSVWANISIKSFDLNILSLGNFNVNDFLGVQPKEFNCFHNILQGCIGSLF